jgi:hypothetical protein
MKSFNEFIIEALTIPSDFKLTLDSLNLKDKNKFDSAMVTLHDAVKQGSIRKVELDTLKSLLNGACSATWEKHYVNAYLKQTHEQRAASPMSKDEEDLYYKDKGFRNMPMIVKKYAKLAHKSSLISMAVQIATEYAPFKDIMDHLKTNTTSGRAPSLNIKPVNPNQVRGTCGWCLRDIAVEKTGLMSHHGFTRPGVGYQTQSCNGVSYKNLEVSLDGLQARIKATEQEKQKLESQLKELPKAITLNIRKTGSKDIITIGKEDPNWAKAHYTTGINLESDIRSITKELEDLKKVLQKWQK